MKAMSLASELLKNKTAEEIAASIDNGDMGSRDAEIKKIILQYKLQKALVDESRCLTKATWVLALATIVLAIATFIFNFQH